MDVWPPSFCIYPFAQKAAVDKVKRFSQQLILSWCIAKSTIQVPPPFKVFLDPIRLVLVILDRIFVVAVRLTEEDIDAGNLDCISSISTHSGPKPTIPREVTAT